MRSYCWMARIYVVRACLLSMSVGKRWPTYTAPIHIYGDRFKSLQFFAKCCKASSLYNDKRSSNSRLMIFCVELIEYVFRSFFRNWPCLGILNCITFALARNFLLYWKLYWSLSRNKLSVELQSMGFARTQLIPSFSKKILLVFFLEIRRNH